jgi:hypothetical protein
MKKLELDTHLKELIRIYFSNPERRVVLNKKDVLMRHKQFNNRLYLVLQGSLKGFVLSPEKDQIELFHATPGMFVGVYSFFSRTFCSSSDVVADTDAEVAYIDADQTARTVNGITSMCEQFMPIVVTELVHRTQKAQSIAIDKQRAMSKLIQTEKLACLGEMAAGIAHELNNSIAVLIRNTEWIRNRVSDYCTKHYSDLYTYYQTGLSQGRRLSTRRVRQRQKQLMKQFNLEQDVSDKIAQIGLSDEEVKQWPGPLAETANRIFKAWDMGAVLRDMRLAGQHSKHVVRSVKAMGVEVSARKTGLDVNESIRKTLSLMGSSLRTIMVQLQLAPLPSITANEGELVQIWTNLIKNAVENMNSVRPLEPELVVTSAFEKKTIRVRVQDNGPGIDPDLLPRIFRPNITTKTDGLSFGLGLGLTIVDRLVNSYRGGISVKSSPGKTIFTISLPEDKNHEQA